jgi:long-subunit acyl-CoA synthetase (AMP-forming)
VRGIIAKKGHIPVGYFKDEKKTAETFQTIKGVRYAIPGDYAEVEADGSVTMLGRGSVSINSGGEKIYPEEVEAALKGHPDVFDALVVGVPDPRFGQHVATGRPRRLRPQGDRGIQGAAQPLARRRGQALARGQARLPLGQGHDRGTSGRRRARQACGGRHVMGRAKRREK